MILAVVIALMAALVAGFWYFGQKPAIHRHLTEEEMRVLLRTLLNQGEQGGALFIRGKRELPFVQVMKYFGRGRVGLQLDFPRADWAHAMLPKAESVLRGFDSKPTGGWNEHGNGMQFITVDFGTDIERAQRCVKQLAEEALGIDLVRDGRAHFEKVSADPNARIGFA